MADDNAIKLSKTDEDAKTLVMDRFHTYRDYASVNYFKKWDSFYSQYRSIIENEAEYPYMARLFIPYSFVSVETVLPRMVETIFASDPIIAVKPQGEEDMQRAEVKEKLLNYQYRVMEYLNTFMMSVKDATIIGTCINMVDWRKTTRNKKRIAKEEFQEDFDDFGSPVGDPTIRPQYDGGYDFDGEPIGKPMLEKYEVTIYDDPYIYYVSPYKLLIDPTANPIDPIGTAQAVILITETTMTRLKELQDQGYYKNISKINQVKGKADYQEGDARLRDTHVIPPDRRDDKHSEKVLLYNYWEDERLIVLAEEKVVIKNGDNPYWHCKKPFTMSRICPVPNEIYGIGMMEQVQSLQHELNDTRNQRIDNIKLALNRMYIIDRGADVDLDALLNEPGGVIMANYTDGVQPLVTPPVTMDAFQNARDIAEDMQRAHGIHDPALGKPTARETATGVLSLQEAANMRFQIMARVFAQQVMQNTELMDELNEQYLPEGKEFRLTNAEPQLNEDGTPQLNSDGTPVLKTHETIEKIEDIIARYDYIPVGASMEGLSKYARIEQLSRWRQTFADNPRFDKTKFDIDIMELLNFKDAKKYFKTMQQLQQEMMAMQAPQVMMDGVANQMGGEGGGMGTLPPGLPPGQELPTTGGEGVADFLGGAENNNPF